MYSLLKYSAYTVPLVDPDTRKTYLCYGLPKGKGGGKPRDVPMSDLASKVLAAHVAAHKPVKTTLPYGDKDGKPATVALLFTDRGRPPRRQYLNDRIWKPALVKAGVDSTGPEDRVGMHALRHYAASSWLAEGANIRDVAEYLGHTDPGFTLRTYAHLMPSAADRLRVAMDVSLASCASDVPWLAVVAEN
jgi:integrase